MNLHGYFERMAERHGDRVAVEEASDASLSYAELNALAGRTRDRLVDEGVVPGDRVGVQVHKSIDTVAILLGILKAGAAYVPVDPTAPATRNRMIFDDCTVKALFIEETYREAFVATPSELAEQPVLLPLATYGGGQGLSQLLDEFDAQKPAAPTANREVEMSSLAYILYTSGSTGKPKGVALSHTNATSFVDWSLETFAPTCDDRFSSHAPFHFDLSILDLYCSLGSGARLVLIPDDVGKEPVALGELISRKAITVWYSAPTILTMLVRRGGLSSQDFSSLRAVLFAGEVFPAAHLRELRELWPHPHFFNLYGPTETNVCTWFEVAPGSEIDTTTPLPIGRVCPQLEGVVLGTDDKPVAKGSEGELCIKGPNVLKAYWNLPEQSSAAFVDDYYRTGDVVIEEAGENFRFVGRRDRMVKKRGYRVELGEIEAALSNHPDVDQAAVVAISDQETGVTIHAHLGLGELEKISLIALKRFCSQRLPAYMIPDKFRFHPSLPMTSTDKVDYQKLQNEAN